MKRDWLFWLSTALYAGGLTCYFLDAAGITAAQIVGIVERFQTLIAGTLAISAGVLALVGSRLQARATVVVADHAIRERRRSVAAAFYAELSSARLGLTAQQLEMRSTDERVASQLPVRIIRLPAFHHDPLAVGCLPADIVYAASQAYDLVEVHNDMVRHLLAEPNRRVTDDYPRYFAARLSSLLNSLDTTLHYLAQYCDLDADLAARLHKNAQVFR